MKPKDSTEEADSAVAQKRLVRGSFTPGPWEWTGKQKILNSAHGKIINYAPYEGMWFARYNEAEDEANARLIEAAPDLLEALQAMMKIIGPPENPTWANDNQLQAAWELTVDATAKAISPANR